MLDVESEVSMFDALVKQTSGFREEQVAHYGIGHLDILSSACLVPGGGFEYSINGKSQSFETTDHLNAFLVHGTSGNVEPWVKGGVLGSFVQTFGDDAGGDMVAKHGHMVGIIPQLIIKNCRRDLRSSHGITIRESTGITTTTADDPNMQYCFWRPMLLAKFSVAGPAKDALMGTGALYLIDNDSSSTEWSGKISYPGNHDDKCTCKSSVTNGKNKKAGCPISKEYAAKKKAKVRVGGGLVGNNRMGKYLMAIRSEIRLLDAMQERNCDGAKKKPKRKKKQSAVVV